MADWEHWYLSAENQISENGHSIGAEDKGSTNMFDNVTPVWKFAWLDLWCCYHYATAETLANYW